MTDRPRPRTESGKAWRQAEQIARKLEETGDTARSFVVKGALGCAGLTAVAIGVIWVLVRLFRLLIG